MVDTNVWQPKGGYNNKIEIVRTYTEGVSNWLHHNILDLLYTNWVEPKGAYGKIQAGTQGKSSKCIDLHARCKKYTGID